MAVTTTKQRDGILGDLRYFSGTVSVSDYGGGGVEIPASLFGMFEIVSAYAVADGDATVTAVNSAGSWKIMPGSQEDPPPGGFTVSVFVLGL